MLYTKNRKSSGFTLIELLVIISIIGFLSSVILTSLNNAKLKAQYASVQSDIRAFTQMAIIAQGEQSQTLLEITQSNCSDCVCRSGDMRNIPDTNDCYTKWIHARDAIMTATNGIVRGLEKMERDPWGSPYSLNENEGEIDCSTVDVIRSLGPNGIWNDTDDYIILIPLSGFCP